MEKLAEHFVAESELQLEHTMEELDIAKSQLLAQMNASATNQCLQRRKQVGRAPRTASQSHDVYTRWAVCGWVLLFFCSFLVLLFLDSVYF